VVDEVRFILNVLLEGCYAPVVEKFMDSPTFMTTKDILNHGHKSPDRIQSSPMVVVGWIDPSLDKHGMF
jgi:hypothetical protein